MGTKDQYVGFQPLKRSPGADLGRMFVCWAKDDSVLADHGRVTRTYAETFASQRGWELRVAKRS